jgi:hypothetical protein
MDITSGRTEDSELGWAIYTRDARRYRVPVGVGAWIELGLAADENERCRFRLLDLSWGGVSFELPLDVDRLATGDRVPDAVIGIGRTTVEGSLEVLYLATDEHGMPRCGGRFVPAAATDETALNQILVRLDHLTTRGLWVAS